MTKGKMVLRYTLTVLLLGIIIAKVGPGKLAHGFRDIRWRMFLWALPFVPVMLALRGYKWKLLIGRDAPGVNLATATCSLMFGYGIGVLTPARVGEVSRALCIESGDRLRLAGLALIDKLFDFLVLWFMAIPGAWYFGRLLGDLRGAVVMGGAALVALAVGFYAVYAPVRTRIFFLFLAGRLPLRDKLERVIKSLGSLSPRLTTVCILITLGAFLINIGQYYVLLSSFQEGIPVLAPVIVFPIVVITNALPLTIGNVGVREWVAKGLLKSFDVTEEAAVEASFLMFVLNILIPGVIGVVGTRGLRWRSTSRKKGHVGK